MIVASLSPEKRKYENIFKVNQRWNSLEVGEDLDYEWNTDSNYIKEPAFPSKLRSGSCSDSIDQEGARALVVLGDSITTD